MVLRRDGDFTSREVGWGARGQVSCPVPKRLCIAVEMQKPYLQSRLNNGFTETWVEAWEGTEDGYGRVLLPFDSGGGGGVSESQAPARLKRGSSDGVSICLSALR